MPGPFGAQQGSPYLVEGWRTPTAFCNVTGAAAPLGNNISFLPLLTCCFFQVEGPSAHQPESYFCQFAVIAVISRLLS